MNEVSTSTDGIDGDFNTTNAACSVLLLCRRCTGLIFFRMCEPSVRLFLIVSVCTRSNSTCCSRWSLSVAFFPATSSARFSRSERYFAMALLAPRLDSANTEAPAADGLVKPSA